MNIKTRTTRTTSPVLENGQVWQMSGSNLRIALVGKRLVHYKHYRIGEVRPATQLSGKDALERYLQKNRAVLIEEAPPAPAPKRRISAPKKQTS